MSEATLCRRLEWDSEFFGFPIARIERLSLDPDEAQAALAWCRREQIRCLYYLCPTGEANVRVAEHNEFRLLDVRLTFERTLDVHVAPASHAGSPVRPFQASDEGALRAIARTSFRETRFFRDPGFPRDRVVKLYEVWLARSWAGDASAVLVSAAHGAPDGFITCHVDPDKTGRIGLVGVGGDRQGTGIGEALVRSALGYCRDAGARTVSVVTQGQNVRAQRLYQRCSFRTSVVQFWYHRWFE